MKMTRTNLMRRCCLAAATIFAGGTVLGTCELRLREAFVTTAQGTVLTTIECLPTMLGLEENPACSVFTQDTTTDTDEEDNGAGENGTAE